MSFIVAVLEIAAYVLMCRGEHNLWLYNAFLMLEYALAAWVVISARASRMMVVAVITGGVVASTSIATDLAQGHFSEDLFQWTPMVNAFLLSVLFTLSLFEQAQYSREPVQYTFWFWVALGGLVFHGCTLPLNGLFRYLCERDLQLADRLYILNDVPFVIYFIMLSAALLAYRRLAQTDIQDHG